MTKINHRTVKRREDNYFFNPYGWTLQHQYEPTTLQKGMDGLTGNDFALASYLQMANSKLEKKDQASFYIGKLCRWVKDEGGLGVDGKTFIANDEPVREGTKIFGAFSFDGKIKNSNFRRISFSPSIHMCTHGNQQPLFWEDKKEKINKEEYSHSATRERWYYRYIILCLPKHSQLELFTQKEMWYESLCFIKDEIQVSSPRFISSIKSVIEKASSSFFKQSRYNDLDDGPFVEEEEEGLWYPDDEPLLTMTQLLVNADDVEMAKMFLRKFYAEKIDYDEKFVDKMPKSSEQALAKLLKSFQWKDLEDTIDDIISHTQVEELFRWIDISSDCGIKEITDKVINICLEKLPEFHEISTAPITSYPNGSEPYYPLWTKIFQKVFTDEYFSNLWWEKLSTCQQIISNIGLVLQFCADLPTECHSKYSIVNKFLIKCLKMRLSVDAYTPLLYAAIKPLFKDTVTYKNEIHDIFNQLLNTNNSRLVGKVLLLITEREKTYSSTEVFKSVIDLYMNWLLIAPEMTAAFDDEITFLTEIIYVRGVVIENPKKLVKICKRITDLKEFSGLIDKLFRVLPKEKEKSHCKFMTELVKVVYCALPNCTWDDTEDLCWVLTALFERGDSYHYILSKMLATEAVTLDDDIMGYTLWSLLTDPDIDIQKLKSNTNFRLLLVNYSLLLQDPQYPEPDMEPDHAYYRTVIKFLLSQPDFPLTHELLPALLQIPFYKKNWKKFLKLVAKVNLEKTETCKMLLTLAVEIFEIVLEEEKRVGRLSSVRYKAILRVFKTVFQDDFYSDIAWQLTSLQAFQINGQSNINKEKQSLEKLIRDLKEDFSQHESYARLVSIRVENLTSLYQEGQPRLHWDQPNAEFPTDENIQAFLRGQQTTYSVLGKFPDLQAAGHWIDAYCRPSFIQSHSFSGIARISNVGSVELILQKERHIYEKENIAFRLLMEELTDLQDELRMFPKFHSKLQASGVKRKREVRL
uniref:Uncharacterized protein n=2 Tax=Clytia hemisphaerica TaxID=252671 RepID=A0A7M5XH36_9CNID